MRVIFLDVADVLNSEAYERKLEERHRVRVQASPELEPPCDCGKTMPPPMDAKEFLEP